MSKFIFENDNFLFIIAVLTIVSTVLGVVSSIYIIKRLQGWIPIIGNKNRPKQRYTSNYSEKINPNRLYESNALLPLPYVLNPVAKIYPNRLHESNAVLPTPYVLNPVAISNLLNELDDNNAKFEIPFTSNSAINGDIGLTCQNNILCVLELHKEANPYINNQRFYSFLHKEDLQFLGQKDSNRLIS